MAEASSLVTRLSEARAAEVKTTRDRVSGEHARSLTQPLDVRRWAQVSGGHAGKPLLARA
jgi:hypothetical protein